MSLLTTQVRVWLKKGFYCFLKEWKTIALREPSQEQNGKEKVGHSCFLWALSFPGSTWQEKVAGIRSQMQKHPEAPTAVLLSALDETACEYRSVGAGRAWLPLEPPSFLGPAAMTMYLWVLRAPWPWPTGTEVRAVAHAYPVRKPGSPM